jgi:Tfp pilus assembly protein PilW
VKNRLSRRASLLDSRGITLMDLLVGLSLMAVAAGGIFAGFKGSLKAWTIAQQYAGEQHNARMVLDWATRRLRMAGKEFPGTAIAVADADDIVFFADTNDNGNAECHRLYLNSPERVVYSYVGEVASCTTQAGQPMSANVEAQTLAVTTLSLQYFDGSGNLLTPLPLTQAQRTLVRRVELTIAANGLQFLPPFTLSTQVFIH